MLTQKLIMTFINIVVANSSLYYCPFLQGTLWDGILSTLLCSLPAPTIFTLEPAWPVSFALARVGLDTKGMEREILLQRWVQSFLFFGQDGTDTVPLFTH